MSDTERSRPFSQTTASPRRSQPIDPDGEEAYQRAKIKAAAMKPPRVPNALNYPNSPTAQAFLRARTQEVPERQPARVANPLFIPAPLDMHARERKRLRELKEAESRGQQHRQGMVEGGRGNVTPGGGSSSSTPTPSPHENRSLPNLNSQYYNRNENQPPALPPPPTVYQHQHQQPHSEHHPPTNNSSNQPGSRMPNTMEPHLQVGPRNPFRP